MRSVQVDPRQLAAIEGLLRDAMQRRREADELYTQVLGRAIGAGMTNTRIAQVVGVSETAIRTWRKRHGKA